MVGQGEHIDEVATRVAERRGQVASTDPKRAALGTVPRLWTSRESVIQHDECSPLSRAGGVPERLAHKRLENGFAVPHTAPSRRRRFSFRSREGLSPRHAPAPCRPTSRETPAHGPGPFSRPPQNRRRRVGGQRGQPRWNAVAGHSRRSLRGCPSVRGQPAHRGRPVDDGRPARVVHGRGAVHRPRAYRSVGRWRRSPPHSSKDHSTSRASTTRPLDGAVAGGF